MRIDIQYLSLGSSSCLDFTVRTATLLKVLICGTSKPLYSVKSSIRLMKKKCLPTEQTLVLRQSVNGPTNRDKLGIRNTSNTTG